MAGPKYEPGPRQAERRTAQLEREKGQVSGVRRQRRQRRQPQAMSLQQLILQDQERKRLQGLYLDMELEAMLDIMKEPPGFYTSPEREWAFKGARNI